MRQAIRQENRDAVDWLGASKWRLRRGEGGEGGIEEEGGHGGSQKPTTKAHLLYAISAVAMLENFPLSNFICRQGTMGASESSVMGLALRRS